MVNQNGYPTLVLVDKVREVAGVAWYRVSVAMRPNGSRGWVREGQLAFYTTSAKIVIDLSERNAPGLPAGRRLKGEYPVAVGRPGLETPTGSSSSTRSCKPSSPGGPYGVLALGISAFQPKLAGWAQGGPVAIHGTNQDELIGKAVSHGCVRMHDKDVLAVSKLVPAGSPVVDQGVGTAGASRRGSPVLALHELHVVGLALGAGVRGGLLEEEQLAAADEAAELVDVQVGAGQVDLDDGRRTPRSRPA